MPRPIRHVLTIVALHLLWGGPLAAQAPAEREALEALRDSLAGTLDTVGLLTLEKKLIAEAKEVRDDPMRHLRLGFLALRLGEIASPSHYDDAASEFQWAIDLRPDWPYPWFGMGLAELGLGDSKVSVVAGLQTMFGKDALTRSANAFARSAQVDPTFVRGLVELSNTSLRQRVNLRLQVALDALRQSAGTPAGSHPEVLLARGRVERRVGDPDSAVAAFRALAAATDSSALARFELGRTRLWRGDLDGRFDYLAGAVSDDSATVALYRLDLQPITADSVLGDFDALRGTYRQAWLERFWRERDQVELRHPGERIAEHYRRLFFARQHFTRIGRWLRQFDVSERYRSGSAEFDDRGVIYVRHGEPTTRAFFNAADIPLNESWRYARSDGDLIFHFAAREDVQDFRLVESLLDILGYSRTVQLQNTDNLLSDPVAAELVVSREQFSPIYQRMLTAGRMGLGRVIAEERLLAQESVRRGTGSDTYEHRYAQALEASCQVNAVGAAADQPLLHVSCGVPGRVLQPERRGEGYLYTVRLLFTATDAAGRVVAAVDTTRRFMASAPVPASEYQVGLVSVPVATSGTITFRLALEHGSDAGVVFERDEVVVAPLAPARLALSDVAIGRRGANVRWRPSPGDTVFLNPVGTFRRSEALELYYEVRGHTAGERHKTTLSVRKGAGRGAEYQVGRSGAGGSRLSLDFEEVAPPGLWRVQRTLSLEKLKPGDYTLEVMVTSGGGVRELRRRAFRVTD